MTSLLSVLLPAWNPLLFHFLENQPLPCCHLAPPGFRKLSCLQSQWKGHRVSVAGTYHAGSIAEQADGQMGLAKGDVWTLQGIGVWGGYGPGASLSWGFRN